MVKEDKIYKIGMSLRSFKDELFDCRLCCRGCGANRISGEDCSCGSGKNAKVYCYKPHFGEEPPLSGSRGSGAVFFSSCSMHCVFCQNSRFSQMHEGTEISMEKLSDIMIDLQAAGCHNINLVSPTHYVPVIVRAIEIAVKRGLSVPIVYNTGGYDSVRTIESLDGVVDIYLVDMKYSSDEMAVKYSRAKGYVDNNRDIVKLMYKQVGGLSVPGGVASKGVIIRLLMMPGDVSGTIDTLKFIREEIGCDAHISVMSQYYPAYKAKDNNIISRRIIRKEYDLVCEAIDTMGLVNGWVQPYSSVFDKSFEGDMLSSNL